MIDYSDAALNSMLQGVLDLLDSAAPISAYMQIYTASKPATPGEAISSQTLIGTVPLQSPAGTVTGGKLVLATPIEEDNAPASGEVAWGRLFDGTDTWVADFDIGLTGSGATFELNFLSIYQGGIIRINYGEFDTV